MESYFDNAATTRADKEVIDLMVKVMDEDYGNPSSKHTKGMEAEEYLDNARKIIAKSLKCDEKNIVFTSGGTEANNQAIIGTALAYEKQGKHIITTSFEHASVLEPMIYLESRGFEVTYLSVDNDGHVDEEELKNSIRDDTILVSVMYTNNEVGAVQDIEKLIKIIKAANDRTLIHVDAIQAYGKYKIYPKKLGIDMLSVSGHKIHGPKGSGFLYRNDKIKTGAYIYGGGQERGFRSGTENVPAIAGLARAAELIYDDFSNKHKQMLLVKQTLIDGLKNIDGAVFNINRGLDATVGAPHILSVSFEGIKSEVLLHAIAADGVYVSSGSACSSNHPGLSGTLKAIGLPDNLLDSTIRMSLSYKNTVEEAEYAVFVIAKHVPVLRNFKSY